MNKKVLKRTALLLLFLFALISFKLIITKISNSEDTELEEEIAEEAEIFFHGLSLSDYDTATVTVRTGDILPKALARANIAAATAQRVSLLAMDYLRPVEIVPGQAIRIFVSRADSLPTYAVYEVNPAKKVVMRLTDSLYAYQELKQVVTSQRTIGAIIQSSLYQDLVDQGVPATVVVRLADLYSWSIDFFKIQPNDSIKLIYEQQMVDDSIPMGTGKILAAVLFHKNKPHYGFYYRSADGAIDGYYNEQAEALKSFFLKAPLNFFRITSRYNLRRFHPVLKTTRPHLGTDYAAPHGTPIMTTADGIIEAMGYTAGNGNYVKVKHNKTYSTQYLHMSRFKAGLRVGSRVKQGDIIGYVGSTGLATGPHVCYRFWKNGKQVDPLSIDLPVAKPMDDKYKAAYLQSIARTRQQLDSYHIAPPAAQDESKPLASNR
ncbi:peptidase M23 [Thermaurantimonas aggregans]|uniref:Peptidase M23 n=1 Tax=Thermaurantimonas aggregans TaxID=2173829 RepID=A0A401XM25_9FLAO|nr:M23 family metallopeptidase [Thermaurantimonas aggregans]MCX8148087.1 M23 family metallopeptidase [Thermaurantimonas aggregans]GCD78075.1 peptidase M23 [Thermaurantimonas aggregans]